MEKDEKTDPVWVIEKRCKACVKCVYACPAGVLSMKTDAHTIYGQMISIDRSDLCIGCIKCENACPDFAIFVASADEFSFSKITKEGRELQKKILENNGQSLPKEEG